MIVYNQIVVILILESVLYLLITTVALEQREFNRKRCVLTHFTFNFNRSVIQGDELGNHT